MQLHHPFGERFVHHSGIDHYYGHTSLIQVQGFVSEGMMSEANADATVKW